MRKELQGKKFDEGKLRYDLLPIDALEEVVKVFTLGANKYGERNWEQGIAYGRLYAASQRHLTAFLKGEEIDEIGTHHVANAIVNLLMLLQFEKEGRRAELNNVARFTNS